MTEVRQTEEFSGWLRRLRDATAVARIRRMEMGNPGDAKSVGQGIFEMRIDYGPGYRICYVVEISGLNSKTSNGLRNWRIHGDDQDNAI
jgi:putative addiction module killer protein